MVTKPIIFISYSHKNQNAQMFIEIFKLQIELYNRDKADDEPEFAIWTDHELVAGDHWSDKIDNAIDDAFAIMVAITPEALDSHYVTYEWAYARGTKKFIVPIILKKIDSMHKILQDLHWKGMEEVTEYKREVQDLIEVLKVRYQSVRQKDKQEHAKDLAQHILNYLEHARRQRLTGDLNNAMTSLMSAEENIIKFHEEFGIQTDADKPTEVDNLEDDVYYEIGRTHSLQGDSKQAEAYYNYALKKNKEHVYSIVGKGVLERQRADHADELDDSITKDKHLQEAKKLFTRALEIQRDVMDHNDESVWASLGGICKRIGEQNDAIGHYSEATKYKQSAYPYGNLGLLYFELGKLEQMVANFRVANYFAKAKLHLYPDDRWAHNDELLSQLVLNEHGEDIETVSEEDIHRISERVLIVCEGDPLKRLKSTLDELLEKNDDFDKSVVDISIAQHILEKIKAKMS